MEPLPHPSRKKITLLFVGVGSVLVLGFLLARRGVQYIVGPPPPPPVIITTGTIQSGDVLAAVLTKQGKLENITRAQIEKAFRTVYKETIQPGDQFEIVTSTWGLFHRFTYRLDPVHSYVVSRSSVGAYSASSDTAKTIWREKRLYVEVTKFLEGDLRSAGHSASLIDNLVYELGDNIFGWKIDFFTEQRKGDKLEVLLEEEYLEGAAQPIKGGKHMRVIAARYTGSGTRVKENIAVRYKAPEYKQADFFDPDGKAMKRQFLRAPFTKAAFRVSSGFNPKRFHPILRVYRPHHGTDYAASVGSPVVAIGDGTVIRAEWYKGYGNCVDIRHANSYVSRYGHLSKILVRQGQHVEQGRLIGRVGNTGLSTGPHLHFEMLVGGMQRNFLRMSFPASSSVSAANMASFSRARDEALARLIKVENK